QSDTTDVRIAAASPFTLPSDLFYKGAPPIARRETVWVQPVDDGGMLGPRVSANWVVRRPITGKHGRLLLLDGLPSPNDLPFRSFYDAFYVSAADGYLPGQYDVLRTMFTQPFRSAEDV